MTRTLTWILGKLIEDVIICIVLMVCTLLVLHPSQRDVNSMIAGFIVGSLIWDAVQFLWRFRTRGEKRGAQ